MSTKSIWDTRFTPPKVALDDSWITINGSHVQLNDAGDVVAGAGGKFAGSNYHQIRDERQSRMPGDVKDMYGNIVPQIPIPKTVDGAKKYFEKMAQAYEKLAGKDPFRYGSQKKGNGRQYNAMARNYRNLADIAEKNEKLTPEQIRKDKLAYHGVRGILNHYNMSAQDDVTGVGKMVAKDLCGKYLPEKQAAKEREHIDGMSYWKMR